MGAVFFQNQHNHCIINLLYYETACSQYFSGRFYQHHHHYEHKQGQYIATIFLTSSNVSYQPWCTSSVMFVKCKLLFSSKIVYSANWFFLANFILSGTFIPVESKATQVTCAEENSRAYMFSGNGATICKLSWAETGMGNWNSYQKQNLS